VFLFNLATVLSLFVDLYYTSTKGFETNQKQTQN